MAKTDASIYAGVVYVNRHDTKGNRTGWKEMLDSAKAEIKVEADEKTWPSHRPENYGQAVSTVMIPKPSTISLTFADSDVETVAMALSGDVQDINVPGTTLAAVEYTVTHGRAIDLGVRNLKDDFKVQDAVGTKTYVLGIDYKIKYASGMLSILPDGNIPDGAKIKVSGTALGYEGKRVQVGANSVIKMDIKLEGQNLANQQNVTLVALDCTFKPTGALDFLKTDFGEYAVEGTVGETYIDYEE